LGNFMNTKVARFVRLAIAVSAAPLLVNAQEPSTDEGMLEEIVVTAQKREESLRDVPLSVEAVSGDKLADFGIVRLDDLKAYVPNLQMTETGIANNIYIRGIGSGLNQGFEQSVSMYMDGIYRGRGHQSRMPFLDLARVEVLRGPQPILFGKNAVAGAINMVAAQPTKEFEGSARASYDVENHETLANVVFSGPLTDTFGARVALYHRNANGYVANATLNRDEPKRNEFAGRVILAGDITDALDVSLRVEAGKYDTDGRQIEIFGETPISTGALAPLSLTYSQIIGGTVPGFITQGRSASALNNTIDHVRSSTGDRSNTKNFESALTFNYLLPGDVTMTSVTGYSNYNMDELCDCDFTGATIFNAGIAEEYDQYSQELRFTSPTTGNFSWIAGLFYQRYELDETDYLHVPSNSLVMSVLAQNPALGPNAPTRAASASLFSNAVNPRVFLQNSKLYSAFAQGTWNLSDMFSITAGARLSKENKEGARTTTLTRGIGGIDLTASAATGLRPLVAPLFNSILGIVPHSVAGSRSESNFSPLVNFQYRFNPESMLYLSLSRGFKSGGFDARSNKPPPPIVPIVNPPPATANTGTFEFEDERATTVELGVKSAVGGTADFNANVFFTDYKDLQTSAFDGAIGFNVGNGSAEVKGLEVEGRWRATPAFMLTGSLAYLDFEWKKYFGQCYFGLAPIAAGQPGAGNCNYAGSTNQLAPKFTGVLGANYKWNVGDNLGVNFGVDLLRSSKYLQSLTLDPANTQSAYTKVNARLALAGAEDRWELALIGRNLTDKTTVSYAGDTPLAQRLFQARSYYGFVDPPRSVAIEARVKF
jgi:iron complex outermembrane recepter protein